MADILEHPAERLPLSADAVGRVRALRQKIDAEDAVYVAAAERLLAAVRVRFRRHPQRNFRPEMLAALEKSWHALPSTYRLACHAELSKDSLTITDVAISAANPECAEWDGREHSFVIASTNLIIRRGTFHADCVVTCVVSLHAAARRLQCGISTSSDDDLLDDVALLAQHNATEMTRRDRASRCTPPAVHGAAVASDCPMEAAGAQRADVAAGVAATAPVRIRPTPRVTVLIESLTLQGR